MTHTHTHEHTRAYTHKQRQISFTKQVVNNSNTQLLHSIRELLEELTLNSGGSVTPVSSIGFSRSVLASPPMMEGVFIFSSCYLVFRGLAFYT